MPRRKNQSENVNTVPTNDETNPKRKADPENKPPSKRLRSDASKPKPERAVQWHSQALRYVQNLVGQPGSNAFVHYSHACLLQLPMQPGILTPQSIHRHFESFPWSTTYPVPLVTHRIQNEDQREQIEPMKKLVKAKKTHMTVLSNLRINFKRKQTIYRRVCRKQKDLFPNIVFKVAEHMERDPDRWFLDAMGYDYYFTGGSLAVVNGESFSWIVNTVGEEMDSVEMVPFDVLGGILTVDTARIERYDLGHNKGPIYEVSWHESNDACEADASVQLNNTVGSILKIALRRKHFVDVMWTKTAYDAMKIKSVQSDIPFISCCLLPRGSGWLMCTSDLEKVVKIWDCNKGKLLHSLKFQNGDKAYDNWTCVRAIRSNYLIYLDRSWIKMIQTSNTKIAMVRETPISSWVWICEKASCFEVYPEEGILFIGTTHKLLVLRMVDRNEHDPPDFEQIITFTHNLKHYPTMISYSSDSNQNFHVWVSSHLPGDTKLCTFSKVPPKRFASKHIPRKLPTMQESYHLARTKGKCIYPATAIKRRLQRFHSGLAMVVDSDHYHLLLQTSFGDIFHQLITPDPEASNASDIPALLQNWMLNLNSLDTSAAVVTDFKNLRGFKKIFTNTNLKPEVNRSPSNNAFKRRSRWQRTTEQLHEYKDMLAAELLAAWGYRPDVTHERRLSTDVPMNASERVSNWLETTSDITTVRSTPHDGMLTEENVVQVGSDDEMNLETDGIEIVGQTQLPQASTADVTIVSAWAPSSVITGTPRSAVKPTRKRYVQGF